MSINEVIDVITRLHNEDVAIAVARTSEIVHCGMEFARKYPRKNDNWDIVWSIPVSDDTEIVIGDRHTDFEPYVAWHCFRGESYAWGHYCQTFGGAFDCAMEKVRNELHLD